jgi:hypothetical protein
MKKKSWGISLNRETLRQLSQDQAEKAVGGVNTATGCGTCTQTLRTCGSQRGPCTQ